MAVAVWTAAVGAAAVLFALHGVPEWGWWRRIQRSAWEKEMELEGRVVWCSEGRNPPASVQR